MVVGRRHSEYKGHLSAFSHLFGASSDKKLYYIIYFQASSITGGLVH